MEKDSSKAYNMLYQKNLNTQTIANTKKLLMKGLKLRFVDLNFFAELGCKIYADMTLSFQDKEGKFSRRVYSMDEPRLIPEKYFEIVGVETTASNMLFVGKRCIASEKHCHMLQNTIVLCSDGNFAKETLHFASRVNEFAKLKIFVLDDNDGPGEGNCKQVSKIFTKALKIQKLSTKYINDDNILVELSKLMNSKNPTPISQ
jgi:hypothetical protein